MTRGVAVLGSTGSIGHNTLKVIDELGEQFRIISLTAHTNWKLVVQQARRFRPQLVAVDPAVVDTVKSELGDLNIRVVTTPEGLAEAAVLPQVDMVVSAIVGTAGLRPTLEAVRAGKDVALANKETLVAAGALVTAEVRRTGVRLIPVDSEHSAIFQCLECSRGRELKGIILTASGGPFRGCDRTKLRDVRPEQAVAHPRWNMGQKISVDSATLMNKGLEVIEARWLFDLSVEQINVVVHPQSIVHSLVELVDGAVIAHLGLPDMRHPIQYALTYPNRQPAPFLQALSLAQVGKLTFEEPDLDTFECLQLALSAAQTGGTLPAAMNAANEAAVDAFLRDKIPFLAIPDVVSATMEAHSVTHGADLETILEVDQWARNHVAKQIEGGGL